jgi:hypothetical protein
MMGMAGGPLAQGTGKPGDKDDYEVKPIPLSELSKVNNAELAETLLPARIAIVTGSFPYKAQVEEFKKALRLTDNAQVMQETVTVQEKKKDVSKNGFHFAGLNVWRRTVGPDGKTSDWEALDLTGPNSPYVRMMLRAGKRKAPEDSKVKPLVVPGLVMPEPLQINDKPYPNLEEQLAKVKETVAALEAKKVTPAVVPDAKFDPETFSAFGGGDEENPTNAGGGGGGLPPNLLKKGPGGATGGDSEGAPAQEWSPPEHCLLRFLDVTVEPGKAYEYQVQVRMTNPNYQKPANEVAYPALTKEPEMLSDKVLVKQADGTPLQVRVPDEIHFYAVDQKYAKPYDKPTEYKGMRHLSNEEPSAAQAVVQVQRWIPVHVIEGRPRLEFPVGSWSVAERLFAYRGEYLAQKVPTKLPFWSPEKNSFALVTNPRARGRERRDQLVEVTYGEPESSPLLVDFFGGRHQPFNYTRTVPPKEEGGRATVTRIDAPGPLPEELLLLSPEGKLQVRSSTHDNDDPERLDRYKKWQEHVQEAENGGPADKNTNPAGGKNPFGKGG